MQIRGFLATVALSLLCACEAQPETTWRVYRVDGESLSHVALKTGVGVPLLRSVNGLRDDLIRDGSGLLVPENPKTLGLPPWHRPLPPPQWKPCPAVTFDEVSVTRADPDAEEPFVELAFDGHAWRTEYPFPGPAPDRLLAARLDLDGDGTREAVVSMLETVGNGLGFETWRHWVFARGAVVASFETTDFGLSYVEQPRGCAFLEVTADWRTDQLRGEGMYFLGQLYVLDGGALRARGPEAARRLTERFLEQRFRTLDHEPRERFLLDWFTSTGAFTWPQPADVGRGCRDTRVVREEDHGYRLVLEGDVVWEGRGWHDPEGEPVKEYDRLVDAATRARLPDGFHRGAAVSWAGSTVQVCESTRDAQPWVELAFP
jgi:hypothetical protein